MIKLLRSMLAGLAAGIASLVVAAVGAWALRFEPGVRRVIEGSPFTQVSLMPLLATIVLVLVGAIAIAVGYAFVFEFVTRSAAWWIGAAIGALQAGGLWLALGVLAGLLPDVGFIAAGELSLLFDNLFVIAWLVAIHLVYGTVVALVYGPTRHPAYDQRIVMWHQLRGAVDLSPAVDDPQAR